MKLFLFILLTVFVISVSSTGLNEDFTWTRISYVWPRNQAQINGKSPSKYGSGQSNMAIVFEGETNTENENSISNYTGSIDYRYETNIPMGANVWKNKLFVTVPRRRLGVPSTLNYVPLDSPKKHNVPLIPYPNWNQNVYPDPSGKAKNFVSVYRVAIDPCDRMWFVDTGIIETLGHPTQVKPTTITVMDLNTEKIVLEYQIPTDQLRPTTGLASITVDVTENTCDDAYAYIPDLGGYGLIVYSQKENKSWRVTHNYFYLESTKGEFFISGHQFQWNDGIFSTELSGLKKDGFRDMYFHAMAGTNMYKVSTKILRNETLALRSYHEDNFEIVGDRGEGHQTSMADIHKQSGIMFLNLVNQNALGCWNTNQPLSAISLVQKDDQKMIYPCDVKLRDDKIYLLTNTMPEFLYGRLNYDQINFRIWSNTVKNAIQGTKCGGRRL